MSGSRTIKARPAYVEGKFTVYCDLKAGLGIPDGTKVAVLDASNPVALVKRVAVLMDEEDGTGAGFDYQAETVLIGLGIVTKRHATKLPRKGRASK